MLLVGLVRLDGLYAIAGLQNQLEALLQGDVLCQSFLKLLDHLINLHGRIPRLGNGVNPDGVHIPVHGLCVRRALADNLGKIKGLGAFRGTAS